MDSNNEGEDGQDGVDEDDDNVEDDEKDINTSTIMKDLEEMELASTTSSSDGNNNEHNSPSSHQQQYPHISPSTPPNGKLRYPLYLSISVHVSILNQY